MEGFLKQGTDRTVMVLMIDSVDHISGKTGLTLTITQSKNGAAFGAISPTVVDRGSGWYSVALLGATNLDTLGDYALHITATGADPSDMKWQVVTDLPGEDDVVDFGIAQSATATTLVMRSQANFGDDDLAGSIVVITSATTGKGQSRVITTNNGATDTLTVSPQWTTTPTGTITYKLYASPPASLINPPPVDVVRWKGVTAPDMPGTPSIAGDQMTLTAAAVDAILDEIVEGSVTLRQLLRGFASTLLGKASGLGTTTAHFRDLADTKDRITAIVDADGNRTAVTRDLT
jgi:hypothetical protein